MSITCFNWLFYTIIQLLLNIDRIAELILKFKDHDHVSETEINFRLFNFLSPSSFNYAQISNHHG